MIESYPSVQRPYTKKPLPCEEDVLKEHKALKDFLTSQYDEKRDPYKMRPIFVRTNVCSKALGSSYLCQRNTSVLCTIFGPKPLSFQTAKQTQTSLEKGSLEFDINFTSFCQSTKSAKECLLRPDMHVFKEKRFLQGTHEEESLANRLAETFQSVVLFEYIPYTSFDVCLTILTNEGGLTSAAINCVSIGLADAGIPMKSLCVSMTIALTPHPFLLQEVENKVTSSDMLVLVDPSHEELSFLESIETNLTYETSQKEPTQMTFICVAFCTSDSTIALLDVQGFIQHENLHSLLKQSESWCIQLCHEIRKQICGELAYRKKTDHLEAVYASYLMKQLKPSLKEDHENETN